MLDLRAVINENVECNIEIQKAHTKWQIREEKNKAIILISYLEFHIIEVPKAIKEYAKSPQDTVLQWMMFLDNPNKEEVTKIMEKNEDIKEAKEELNQLSKDEVLRRIALKEKLLRMDINQAKADAEEYGRAEATKETKEEIIKKMYEIDITVEHIAKVVNLEVSEVKKILNL